MDVDADIDNDLTVLIEVPSMRVRTRKMEMDACCVDIFSISSLFSGTKSLSIYVYVLDSEFMW